MEISEYIWLVIAFIFWAGISFCATYYLQKTVRYIMQLSLISIFIIAISLFDRQPMTEVMRYMFYIVSSYIGAKIGYTRRMKNCSKT